jgi:CheY-like chemotaxis protein/glycine cleavage system H lipoate-binding protein
MYDNPKLLVVDDEPVICQACQRVFSRQGFQVEETTNPREGLSRATEGDYSAVLLDIKMPEMDGIQFLEELRKKRPDLPVMIMTGYPSIPNAAASVRLGASDYITKPFTPEGITQTVRRVLAGTPTQVLEAPAETPEPQEAERRFLNEAWLQLEADGTASVGAVLPHSQALAARAVQLPPVGEAVYQGLPLAGLTMTDGSLVIVPSPVSGVVVSVNESLNRDPSVLLNDPCGEGWIACICTTRLEEEIDNCKPRHVILLSADGSAAREQRRQLESLGCAVDVVEDWAELPAMARRLEGGVLVFDAASLGDTGPELLWRVNAEARSLKVVVVGSPGCRWETAYRQQRIFYYAVEPFADNEIVEILNAAFRIPPRPRGRAVDSRLLSEPVGGVRITNRQGHKVQLLPEPALLRRGRGLGGVITAKLRDRTLPVVTTVGEGDIRPATVLKAAGMYDRVMVLSAKDTGRLPGSLVRDAEAEYVSGSRENAGKVTTLLVQPDPETGGLVGLDDRTTEALAEHIVQEMISY